MQDDEGLSTSCLGGWAVPVLLRAVLNQCVLAIGLALQDESVHVTERLATSDYGASGSNPAGVEILSEPKQRFIAQSS